MLSEGKTKVLTAHESNPNWVRVHFKDQATAFNAQKVATIEGKGALNAQISKRLFTLLAEQGLATCYVSEGNAPNELIYQHLTMLPLEVIVRNVAWGSLLKRFPFYSEGERLKQPLVEFCYKSDAAGDPPVPESLIEERGWLPEGVTLEQVKRLALLVNEAFCDLFSQCGIDCADFKLELGLNAAGELLIADELSPDSFRLRDAKTGQILDKDVFRLDKGDLATTYQSVLDRLDAAPTEQAKASALQAYEALVLTRSKANVLHPESRTVLQALHSLGYPDVHEVKAGKRFSITLQAPSLAEAERQVNAFSDELLANPVIEDFEVLELKPVRTAKTAEASLAGALA